MSTRFNFQGEMNKGPFVSNHLYIVNLSSPKIPLYGIHHLLFPCMLDYFFFGGVAKG
jgi:hypothetical protein